MVAQENVSSRVFQENNEVKAHFSVREGKGISAEILVRDAKY